MWFKCSQSSNAVIAERFFLQVKIRNNIKWLFINLIAIVILTSNSYVLGDACSFVLVLICFLNACYYVINLIVLYFLCLKLEVDTPMMHDCDKIASKMEASQSVLRYFENGNLTFLCRYEEYFNHIVRSLGRFRLKRIDQNLVHFSTVNELRDLMKNLIERCVSRANRENSFQDSRYRLDFWHKYDRTALVTQSQLDTYWKGYLKATKNDLVKYSTAQDSSCQAFRSHDGSYQKQLGTSMTSCQVPIPSILPRLKYQISSKSDPNEVSQRAADCSSYLDLFTVMRSHHREMNFSPSLWVTNLRIWLSTKINEIVQQFDTANELLKSCGEGVAIGKSDVSSLRSVLETYPSLTSFIPLLDFLNLCHDQGYLMWRYRVLSSDGCMRLFSWDSGGSSRGIWNPATGPNDSEVVLHFFSTYLDMKLPCCPLQSPCKRPFTDSYVLVGPNRKTTPYANLAIFQQWVSPPHFNILVGGNQVEMPRGSSNVFLAIGYLLYCVKVYHNGKIGPVSLGKQGLNILWIVGDTSHP